MPPRKQTDNRPVPECFRPFPENKIPIILLPGPSPAKYSKIAVDTTRKYQFPAPPPFSPDNPNGHILRQRPLFPGIRTFETATAETTLSELLGVAPGNIVPSSVLQYHVYDRSSGSVTVYEFNVNDKIEIVSNTLKDDEYIYNGNTYSLKKHGFAKDVEFVVEEKTEKTSSDSDRIVTDNTTDTDSFIGDISEAVDTAIDDAKDIGTKSISTTTSCFNT